MADVDTLPIVNAIRDLESSNTDNRQRLQKSLRAGMLNITKSVDRLHQSLVSNLSGQMAPAVEYEPQQVEPVSRGGGLSGLENLIMGAQTLFQFATARATSGETELTKSMGEYQKEMGNQFTIMSGMFTNMAEKLRDIAAIGQRLLQLKINELQESMGMPTERLLDGPRGLIAESIETINKTYARQNSQTAGTAELLRAAIASGHRMGAEEAVAVLAKGRDGKQTSPVADQPQPVYGPFNTDSAEATKMQAAIASGQVEALNKNTDAIKKSSDQEERNFAEKRKQFREQSLWFGKYGLFGESVSNLRKSIVKLGKNVLSMGGEGVLGSIFGKIGSIFGAPGKAVGVFAGRLTWKLLSTVVGALFRFNPMLAGLALAAGGFYLLGQNMMDQNVLDTAPTPEERTGLIEQSTEQNEQLNAINRLLESGKLTDAERAEFEGKKKQLEESLANLSKDIDYSYRAEELRKNLGPQTTEEQWAAHENEMLKKFLDRNEPNSFLNPTPAAPLSREELEQLRNSYPSTVGPAKDSNAAPIDQLSRTQNMRTMSGSLPPPVAITDASGSGNFIQTNSNNMTTNQYLKRVGKYHPSTSSDYSLFGRLPA